MCITDYKRGVDIVGTTSFIYRGEAISFTWKNHGFKLHLPEKALPPDITECPIQVNAALCGQFEFSNTTELVSGVYSIHCHHSFAKPVTMEIQHYSAVDSREDTEDLSFAVSTGDKLPYKFDLREKGVFAAHSQFGAIELKHFCKYAIVRKRKEKRNTHNLYRAYLLNIQKDTGKEWDVIFSIIQDSELHEKVTIAILTVCS